MRYETKILPDGLKLSEYTPNDLKPYGVLPCGEPKLLAPFQYYKHWKVPDGFAYISKEGWFIEIKGNFLTDLASIPRALRVFYGGDGRESIGAIIHDWLYQHHPNQKYLNILTGEMQLVSRKQADQILFDVCRLAWCSPVRSASIYRGVRLGGWVAWSGYSGKARKAYKAAEAPKPPSSPV